MRLILWKWKSFILEGIGHKRKVIRRERRFMTDVINFLLFIDDIARGIVHRIREG